MKSIEKFRKYLEERGVTLTDVEKEFHEDEIRHTIIEKAKYYAEKSDTYHYGEEDVGLLEMLIYSISLLIAGIFLGYYII